MTSSPLGPAPDRAPTEALGGLDLHALKLALLRRWRFAAAGALAGCAGASLWLWNIAPVYRASATLRLEEDSGGGALAELAALGKAPPAAAEIAVLSSRQLAETTVAAPQDPASPDPDGRQLGLAVRVEDPRRRPLPQLLCRLLGRSLGGRVRAALLSAEEGAPQRVELRFGEDSTRVRLRSADGALPFGGDSEELEFTPGEAFEALGLELVLTPEGDLAGRRLVLERDQPIQAVRRLVGNTRVVETQRNSGVLSVTVSDSDPRRAAEAANALVANYLARSVDSGRRRASQAVEFIEGQLESQGLALEAAEQQVVELQRLHPETIDASAAAGRLIDDLGGLELSRMQLQLARVSIDDARAQLAASDLGGLSRLPLTQLDPLGVALIEQLSQLHLALQLQDRSDASVAKQRLSERADLLGDLAVELERQAEALAELLAKLAEGDRSSLAMLGLEGGGIVPDALTAGYLAQIAELDGRIDQLGQELTEEHQLYRAAVDGRAALLSRLDEHLGGRLAGLRAAAAERRAEAERATERLARSPEAERALIREALDDLRARASNHLAGRAATLEAEDSELSGMQARLEQRLAELPERELALAAPLRRLATHKELVTYLLKSLQEAQINRAVTVPQAEVVDPAIPPANRYAPRLSLTVLGALLAGLAAGFGFGALAERLRDALHSAAELESASGLPVLASIPDFTRGPARVPGAGEGFCALRDEPHGPIAEAYRSLRANLRFAAGELDALRTIAVTSCSPGEGKSTTNVDLAWAYASGGRRVLLVDADLRRPAAHRYLGLEGGPGLAEVLAGELDWRQAIQHTTNPHLKFLSAGALAGSASDVLDGEPARVLLEQLRDSYDLVVFDLPPALVVADVEGFAHRLDGVVLLYRSGGLPREAVRAALLRLRQAGVHLVGAVLNADRGEGQAARYGSYGTGAHSYYLAAGSADERRSA